MKSKRKLWVTLTLACLFVGISFLLLTPRNISQVSASNASTGKSASSPARPTLHVSGRYQDLKFEDAADLPENLNSSIARPVSMVNADLNNDSTPDLITIYNGSQGGEVRVRLGSKLGTYDELPLSYQFASALKAVTYADLNADGLQDVVVADQAGSLSVLFGSSEGRFLTGPTLSIGGDIVALAKGDLNHDSLDDIVLVDQASNTLRMVLGNGDLATAKPEEISTKGLGRLVDVKLADFDNDNFTDIVLATNDGVQVFYGDGKGKFPRQRRLDFVNTVTGMVVTDLNGDHYPDLAISSPDSIYTWNTRLDKGFSKVKAYPAGAGVHGLSTGNYNADDLNDLSVVNDNGQVGVLLNKKNGNFSEARVMDVDGGAVTISSGNFRNNGIDGIAIGKQDGYSVLALDPRAITIQVSTLIDENDCAGCTSAQLLALTPPGGSTGVSLREALNALNNDFILLGQTNKGVGFQNLSTQTGTNNTISDVQALCTDPSGVLTPRPYWLIALNGNLPPILAPGVTIDGTVVNTSATTGANNPFGPEVVLTGGGIVVTSSAPNALIRGLAFADAPGNALTITSNTANVNNNTFGYDCDTFNPGSANPTATNGGVVGVGVLLTGTSNTQVTNNFIGYVGSHGVQINGISLAIPVPQNNVVNLNTIGLDAFSNFAGNVGDGVRIQAGATGNTVSNSVISANGGYGINVTGNITSNAIMTNNRIGTDPAGVTSTDILGNPLGNLLDGVGISTLGNSKFNTLSQSIVSGNAGNGVSISSGDVQAQFNLVTNNKIGVNVTGSVQIPNVVDGLLITGSSNGNTVGGQNRTTFNQIAGNGSVGVQIGGAVGLANPNNNVVINNDIGLNNLGTGAPFDPASPADPQPKSNKGGGFLIDGAAFSNVVALNNIAFNADSGTVSGLTHTSTGNFNTFTGNNIFLNPPDLSPATPQILVNGGNEGMTNGQVNNQALTSLIKIDSAVTVTSTGQTTLKGTANFLDNGVPANINNATIEIFVSKRGSDAPTDQTLAEGQLFLNSVISFQPDSQNPNTVDWSASLVIPAPFLNPVQTNTVYVTATITSGDGSTSPFSIGFVPQFVSGTSQCGLTVSPTTLSFANAPVNTPTQQTVTLTNSGTALLTITNIGFATANTAFSVTGPQLPITLSAGSSQTVTVTFNPTNNTNVSNTLNITNSCTGVTSIPATGNGCQVTLAANPTSVNFGNVNVGATSMMSVTVTNSGCQTPNTPFTFQAVLSANSSSAFSIMSVQGNKVNLVFSPGGTGTGTGTLVISNPNASNSPLNVPLTGTGQTPPAPVLRVQPANVIFGDVPVNTTATQSVTLINNGNVNLTVNTPVVQTGGTIFSVTTPPKLTLAPGETTTFQVSFTPVQNGVATGSVMVSSNGGNQTITLTGNGTAAAINVVTPTLDFGVVTTNTTSTRSVALSNAGTTTLNITSYSIGGNTGFSLPSTAGFSINPGATGSIPVNFTPLSGGAKSDTLTINSNDPLHPTVTVSLLGSGTDTTPPTVNVTSPGAGVAIGSGQTFPVSFTASDNSGVTSFEVRLSINGGSSFDISLGTGTASNGTNSFTAVAPNGIETSQARVQVLVRDNANNLGSGTSSGTFVIGAAPILTGPSIANGRFRTLASGSNIQQGAVLVVNGQTFPLVLAANGVRYKVKASAVGSSGTRFSSLATPGSTLTVTVRNPNGISSSPATVTAQ